MRQRNIYLIILFLIIIFIFILPVSGEIVKKPITYRILVDQYHGFYRVYEVYNKTLGKDVNYRNGTLNINKGDTIIWINDAVPDIRLTIMSQQKLWNNYSGELKWAYKQFNYTFNKSGIFELYVKGYSKSQFKQKIVVGPLESKNITKSNSTNTIKSNSTNVSKKSINITKNSINITKKENLSNSSKTKVLNSTNITNISEKGNGELKLAAYTVLSPILLVAILSTIHIFNRKIKNKDILKEKINKTMKRRQ